MASVHGMSYEDEDDYVVISRESKSEKNGKDKAPQNPFLDAVSSFIDSVADTLWPVNLTIHDNPQLNYHEVIAHKALVDFMRSRRGWKVDAAPYGISTAFIAEYGSDKIGPVISLNAEYDALPEIGHACGHNLIAMASLSAALAIEAIMSSNFLPGKVVLYGTPAEEGGGGKIKLLDAGAYKDHKVDVSLISHPGIVNDSAVMRTAAIQSFKVEYFGREAHAAAAPWEGINALDALIVGYNGLSVLRQQTMPGDIIQGHITDGGLATNIIHAYAAGTFVVRADTKRRLSELYEKVVNCFKAGATATGAKLKITRVSSYADHVPNLALGRVYRDAFNQLGGAIEEEGLDYEHGKTQASTDQGDISYAMPSLNAGFWIRSPGAGPHTPGFTEAARTRESFECALRVGKGLAMTGLEVLMRKGLVEEVKKEWEESMKKNT
jgi:amidohydrolase